MKKYYQYANHIICFDFPEELPLVILRQHLPNLLEVFPQKAEISIIFKESSEPYLNFDLQQLNIVDSWNKNWLVDLPHLLYSYLKFVFFHKEIYFIHSCMIEDTLFIGHSGSGKTTLCIEALNQGFSVSSADRTCLRFEDNSLDYLSGTDVLSVRQEELQPALDLIHTSGDRNIYEIDLNFSKKIRQIKLFQFNEHTKEKTIDGLSTVHQLFPFFLDNIKTDCFVQNGKLLFCPVYEQLNKRKLFQNLEGLDIPVSFVSGSLTDILSGLNKE